MGYQSRTHTHTHNVRWVMQTEMPQTVTQPQPTLVNSSAWRQKVTAAWATVCPFACLSPWLSICPFSLPVPCLPVFPFVCLPVCPTVPLSSCLPFDLSPDHPVCASVYLPDSMSICFSVCSSVRPVCSSVPLSACLPFHLCPICLSIYIILCPSVCLFFHLPSSACLSAPLSTFVPLLPSPCLF